MLHLLTRIIPSIPLCFIAYALAEANTPEPSSALAFQQTTNTRIAVEENHLRFFTGGSERMTIDAVGNVGIGRLNPNVSLELAPINEAGIALSTYRSATNSSRLDFTHFSIQRNDVSGNPNNLSLNPNGGNVGIGTDTPQSKLQISGINRTGVRIGGPNSSVGAIADLAFRTNDDVFVGGTNYWNFSYRSDSWSGFVGDFVLYSKNASSYTSPFIAQTDGDVILVSGNGAARNGNVGIGTIAPGYKLHVAGDVRATKFRADGNTWADFVFDDNYKLNELDQVEKYIEENHHLPEIPSASEVAANGIDIVDMQAKLLQKIEELTLYVIEQNKRIEQQQERIMKLESQ